MRRPTQRDSIRSRPMIRMTSSSSLNTHRSNLATSMTSSSAAICCSQRHASIRSLIRTYGAPLAVYYLLFNECLVVFITYLLHTGTIDVGDIVSLLEYLGLENYVNVRGFSESSKTVMGIEVSGRLLMNFGIATAFMSLWTPLQLPFCIATLPTILRWCGRGAAVPVAAAAATSATP